MPLNLKTHHVTTNKNGEVTGTRVIPYIRVGWGDEPPVYMQDGQFFSEEAGGIDDVDLPDWAIGELARCSDQALQEVKCPDDVMDQILSIREKRGAEAAQKLAAKKRTYNGNR